VNILASRVPLRIRGVPEILDLAFVFAAGNPRVYYRLMALLGIPLLGIFAAARYALGWPWVYVWLLAIPTGALAQGVFTTAAGELLFAENARARSVLRSFVLRLSPYLGSLVLSRAIASFVAIIPFFARLLGRAAFVREAVLLERASSGQALARSASLVRRQEGPCFAMWMSLLLMQGTFVAAAELLGHSVVEFSLQLGRPFGSIMEGGSLYALIGFVASIPYVATARFLKYIDIRTRKEGWDIQIKFTALAAEAEPSPLGAAVA
jgi:hypothetical protein